MNPATYLNNYYQKLMYIILNNIPRDQKISRCNLSGVEICLLAIIFSQISLINSVTAAESFCPGGSNPNPNVIWCDDFEDTIPIASKYYEFEDNNGEFTQINTESIQGSHSLRARFQAGELDAGHFMYNFGRNPIGTQSYTNQDFNEIYWRIYFKLQEGFVGYPDKLTRATIFAGSGRQQAMIAHVWHHFTERSYLLMDPVSGINDNSELVTTSYNDFGNFIWMGNRRGTTSISPGRWYCVETHVKLNSAGNSDGILEFWIDGNLEASRNDLNYVKSWSDYGLNSVIVSNYWNDGSPVEQERYLDAFVISKQRIGCIDDSPPAAPENLRVVE